MKIRNTLRRKRQKEKTPEIRQAFCDEILEISNKINFLKQEVVICQKIEEQNQKIKINIKELQKNENEKENKKIKQKGDARI